MMPCPGVGHGNSHNRIMTSSDFRTDRFKIRELREFSLIVLLSEMNPVVGEMKAGFQPATVNHDDEPPVLEL